MFPPLILLDGIRVLLGGFEKHMRQAALGRARRGTQSARTRSQDREIEDFSGGLSHRVPRPAPGRHASPALAPINGLDMNFE
jgi:hypothetical protein